MKRMPWWTGLLAMTLAALLGCDRPAARGFLGYLEGEFVYMASPVGGTLTNLAVARGTEVQVGQLLFELDPQVEAAAVGEAQQRLTQARARHENLTKGRRPSEIATLEAQLARAQANVALAETELARANRLRDNGVISTGEFDQARARRDADRAQREALMAELVTARLGARADEIAAAAADVGALEAALAKAEWALGQKRQHAPANARVQDTLYRPGEWVAPGNPVVVLLPPENVKARFFVPQPALASVRIGQTVSVAFDNAPAPLAARVNYISSQAEFTPPVIYSQENRAKLVYMVEAGFAPEAARDLRPGQPVDVRLNP